MANVTPPATVPPPPPATPAATVTPVEATVTSLPDKIQSLLRQIQVNATVAQPPDAGSITLNTNLGVLNILLPKLADDEQQQLLQQLNALFQSQRPITVIVQPGDPPTQAFLLLPPAVGTQTQSAVQQTAGTTTVNFPAVPATVGSTLTALVLPQLSSPSVAAELPAAFAAGQPIISPATPTMPQPSQNMPVQDGLTPTILPQSQTVTPAAPVSPQPSPALLQPGEAVDVQINAIVLPAATAQATIPIATASAPTVTPQTPLPQPGPNQIVATVTGTGPNGQLILSAGNATLYVRQNANLPVGTQLLVTVTPSRSDIPAPLVIPDLQNFSSLQQVVGAIAQINPQLAQQILSHIPQPSAAMPGAMLFMLSAFKQGDVRGWLGDDAVDMLTKAGKLNLITKLVQELDQAAQPARDSVVGEWRSYPLPINNNAQFQMLNLYVHSDGQRQSSSGEYEARQRGASHVRFLIDMRMSRLGAIQLDGFVQPKKLDMIVRSENILPNGLHNELRNGYINALSAVDYAGSLNFQVGRQHWLAVQNASAQAGITT